MIKKQIFYVVSAILLCSSYNTLAQTEPEDIALDTKQFEESFYESLKHKGMENYDKAIYELEKCDNLQPNNEAVIF